MRALLLSACALGVALWAQSNFARLSGNIEDPQSKPVNQAHVQLKSVATGLLRNAAVGLDGLYDFSSLAPGEYELEVHAAGFAPLTRRMRLEVGQQMLL